MEDKKQFTLKSLTIRLCEYGEFKGKYLAVVKYEGDKGSVELKLDATMSEKLLRFCGQSIKECSEEACHVLNESIEESIRQTQLNDSNPQ